MDMPMPDQSHSVAGEWETPLVYEFFTPPDGPLSLADVLDMDLESLKTRLRKLQAGQPR